LEKYSTLTYRSKITGNLFDSKTSVKKPACLELYPHGEVVFLLGEGETLKFRIDDIEIESRLGNTMRRIFFPGGIVFETADNDAVDHLSKQLGTGSFASFIHRLESRWRYFALSMAIVVLAVFSGFKYGLPAMAKTVAFSLPSSVLKAMTLRIENSLDSKFLGKSGLSPKRIRNVRQSFKYVVSGIKESSDYNFRILVRKGGILGANAFALPDGAVVVTDELVKMSKDRRELISVFAHEIGHVVNRHGLRIILQDSVVSLIVIYVTGDVLSYASTIAAFPAVLINRGYSRDFEREADGYAFAFLKEKGIDTGHFAAILTRLTESHGQGGEGVSLLLTHPMTEDRIRKFMSKK